MRMLLQRLQRQQTFGTGDGFGQAALQFQRRGFASQALAPQGLKALACGPQPLSELRQIGIVVVAEQGRVQRLAAEAWPDERWRDGQRRCPRDHLDAELSLQRVDALSQAPSDVLGRLVGPQQRCDPGACGRALDGEQGQHGRVAPFQHHALSSHRNHPPLATQVQTPAWRLDCACAGRRGVWHV
ncbi:MAG TPA: hypothetical protein VFY73_14615 [Ideonella sp.]|uniref:hypothetical protein n=1 Tax=Ideonella sp. TaxID=1929293 RepID=UPI002E349F04|nr:hypothetical protein [Ideonella sp.]HEX5685253.1 hypothetical protein [Ideonella sp.]